MAERIELPGRPTGTTEQQLENLYNYLYRMAQTMNINLSEIGDAGLTDDEQILMNQLTAIGTNSQTDQGVPAGYDYAGQQTLKSLVIKTAEFVKTALDAYKIVLFGETEAGGQYGDYRLKQGLRVDVNPEGIKQTYSFAEVVKGLKTYEINAKNYIKTGYLRTENSIPIYGVQIGKDIVTFAEDGTETYHDGNKVAELTADQLTFFHGGNKMASFNGTEVAFYINNVKVVSLSASALTFFQSNKVSMKLEGNRIGFYNNGTEYMYITNGKIYAANDMYIGSGKKIILGDWEFDNTGAKFWKDTVYSGVTYHVPGFQIGDENHIHADTETGIFYGRANDRSYMRLYIDSGVPGYYDHYIIDGQAIYPTQDKYMSIGKSTNFFNTGYFFTVRTWGVTQESSRDVKHDIQDMPDMGEKLDRLRPVTYVYDGDPDEKKRYGLIYEETEGILPEICSGDEGEKALNYVEMVPMLLKEIQSLRARVTELEGRE